MISNLSELREARDWAVNRHRSWKQRLTSNDLVASGQWNTVWDDLTVDVMDPQVENLYLEALTDKAAAARAIEPLIFVGPTTGTRKDQGEKNAERKRKVFRSYMQLSRYSKKNMEWFLDWWQCGAAYGAPWVNWQDTVRRPYFMRFDPRHVYPLAHDGLGNMTAAFTVKVRRLKDIKQEWPDHPSVAEFAADKMKGQLDDDHPVEEVWTFDKTRWSVAIYDANDGNHSTRFRYATPTRQPASGTKAVWLASPEEHGMDRCPLVENRYSTFDGEYRGPLDAMVPGLKTAQHIMARVLEDVNLTIYSPVVFDNILNPEEYGPNAKLLGDGQGPAAVTPVRTPVNFEAGQRVAEAMEGVRNVGKYPQQRGGEPGASIVSAKGVSGLQGGFNTEMALAQSDQADFLAQLLSVTAEFDEKWCPGLKSADGFDQGELYDINYDPAKLFNGDYRVWANYGGSLGLDDTTYLIRLQSMKQLGSMSNRTFMQKSNLIDNVLAEETELAMDAIFQGTLGLTMQQALEAGNTEPLKRLVELIDGEETTARAAVLEVAGLVNTRIPGGSSSGGGAGGPQGAVDPVQLARSQASGGTPAAEGQAQIRNTLASVLPPGVRRSIGEAAPGGTAA